MADSFRVGDVSFVRGIKSHAETSIDDWFRSLIREEKPPFKRERMFGADAGRCARLNVLHSVNRDVFSVNDASSLAYMKIGSALEELFVTALRKSGRLLYAQYWLPDLPRVRIGGKIDLIFQDHTDNLAIGEIKSCAALPMEPKWTHLVQAQMYAAVTGFDRCYLVYASREVQARWGQPFAIRTFEVDTSHEVLRQRLETAALSQIAIEKSVLPEMPAWFRKNVECIYCPFQHICWDGTMDSPVRYARSDETTEMMLEASALADEFMSGRSLRYAGVLEHLAIDSVCVNQQEVAQAELERFQATL